MSPVWGSDCGWRQTEWRLFVRAWLYLVEIDVSMFLLCICVCFKRGQVIFIIDLTRPAATFSFFLSFSLSPVLFRVLSISSGQHIRHSAAYMHAQSLHHHLISLTRVSLSFPSRSPFFFTQGFRYLGNPPPPFLLPKLSPRLGSLLLWLVCVFVFVFSSSSSFPSTSSERTYSHKSINQRHRFWAGLCSCHPCLLGSRWRSAPTLTANWQTEFIDYIFLFVLISAEELNH